ncbi:MAG: dephospho-CoA kinase [Alphaproteobacteria bacterium 41-28]|nr:MAG: dephospho-CoA kinase [Alphaproteobacteria bacterium 41-28]
MWILGLTGALGAGKSTLAKYLRQEGVPVHCSDNEIHALLSSDPDVKKKIKTVWPEVFVRGKIDRNELGNLVFFSSSRLTQLENILYPKLMQRQRRFLTENQRLKVPLVALDVPLLCEVGLDRYCHYVLMAAAPFFLRKQRVLNRKGMTVTKFQALTTHQMDEQKRLKHADFVIRTGLDKGSILKKIRAMLLELSQKPVPKWRGKWPIHIRRRAYGTRNRIRH